MCIRDRPEVLRLHENNCGSCIHNRPLDGFKSWNGEEILMISGGVHSAGHGPARLIKGLIDARAGSRDAGNFGIPVDGGLSVFYCYYFLPVSYTHLDVYKRQVHSRPESDRPGGR